MQKQVKIGIYEKALPKHISWEERCRYAEDLGFDFIEMSIDETDARLSRLDWSIDERSSFMNTVLHSGVQVPSICLSAHRRFPFGSRDPSIRKHALEIIRKAVKLASDTGIRTVQLAGYDVYYEESSPETVRWFIDGLADALEHAAQEQVMLSMEMMDYEFMNSVEKFLSLREQLPSPWFGLYPDVGNLSAWGRNLDEELEMGMEYITCIHLKDTLAVTETFPGKFKEVPFGNGCVDFSHVFLKLKELGYQGPFLMEMWTETSSDPIGDIRSAKQWILQQMDPKGYASREEQGVKQYG